VLPIYILALIILYGGPEKGRFGSYMHSVTSKNGKIVQSPICKALYRRIMFTDTL